MDTEIPVENVSLKNLTHRHGDQSPQAPEAIEGSDNQQSKTTTGVQTTLLILGIVQVILGCVCMGCGIILLSVPKIYSPLKGNLQILQNSGTGLWCGIPTFTVGILAIELKRTESVRMIILNMIMATISTITMIICGAVSASSAAIIEDDYRVRFSAVRLHISLSVFSSMACFISVVIVFLWFHQLRNKKIEVTLPTNSPTASIPNSIKSNTHRHIMFYIIGMFEVMIACVCIMIGITLVIATMSHVASAIWCSAFLFITGILAMELKHNDSLCIRTTGMVMAFISAFFMAVAGCVATVAAVKYANSQSFASQLHIAVAVLSFSAVALTITHALWIYCNVNLDQGNETSLLSDSHHEPHDSNYDATDDQLDSHGPTQFTPQNAMKSGSNVFFYIGVIEINIACTCIGCSVILNALYFDANQPISYISTGIWCSLPLFATGILAALYEKYKSWCLITGGMVMAIISSVFLAGSIATEVVTTMAYMIPVLEDMAKNYKPEPLAAGLHGAIACLSFVGFVLTIAHGIICCIKGNMKLNDIKYKKIMHGIDYHLNLNSGTTLVIGGPDVPTTNQVHKTTPQSQFIRHEANVSFQASAFVNLGHRYEKKKERTPHESTKIITQIALFIVGIAQIISACVCVGCGVILLCWPMFRDLPIKGDYQNTGIGIWCGIPTFAVGILAMELKYTESIAMIIASLIVAIISTITMIITGSVSASAVAAYDTIISQGDTKVSIVAFHLYIALVTFSFVACLISVIIAVLCCIQLRNKKIEVTPPTNSPTAPIPSSIKSNTHRHIMFYIIGMFEVMIACVCIMIGITLVIIPYELYDIATMSHVASAIWCSAFLFITGILAMELKHNDSLCIRTTGMVMAFISAFFMAVAGCVATVAAVKYANSQSFASQLHIAVAVLSFSAVALTITHALWIYCNINLDQGNETSLLSDSHHEPHDSNYDATDDQLDSHGPTQFTPQNAMKSGSNVFFYIGVSIVESGILIPAAVWQLIVVVEINIASICIGCAIFLDCYPYKYPRYAVLSYLSTGIWCSLPLFVTGILATLYKKYNSWCMITGNMVMAIISSILLLGSASTAVTAIGAYAPTLIVSQLHGTVSGFSFIGFILAIAHAILCCCKGHTKLNDLLYLEIIHAPHVEAISALVIEGPGTSGLHQAEEITTQSTQNVGCKENRTTNCQTPNSTSLVHESSIIR